MRHKNPTIRYKGDTFELYWTTQRAQHIAERHYSANDTARHLNIQSVEDLLLAYDDTRPAKRGRVAFFKKLEDGKQYVVIADISNGKCFPVSGRIDNNIHNIK